MQPSPLLERSFRLKEVAAAMGVTHDVVVRWIKSGQLAALDVSSKPGGRRPHYRIPASALEAFRKSRSVAPAPKVIRQRPQKRSEVIEFY